MPQGLQVFDASGRLTLDISDRITRIIDTRSIVGQGSVNIPALANGTPFAFGVLNAPSNNPRGGFVLVTVAGTVVTYRVPSGVSATLISGLF